MQVDRRFWAVAGFAASAIAMSFLAGCSTGGGITPMMVADSGNNRVVIYDSPLTTDEPAVAVLGQPDFGSHSANQGGAVAANTLSDPEGVRVFSATGRLGVLDRGNCRALIFAPPFTSNMNANTVLGQPDFATGCGAAASATTLGAPTGAAVDSQGNLWIADAGFSRVVKYPSPFSNGEAATVVLGQKDFVSSSCNQGAIAPVDATLCAPFNLAFDSSGNLWVADSGNHRVLMYPPAAQVTGGAATVVLGQANFVSHDANQGLAAPTAATLDFPTQPLFDANGNLWVADAGNNRVVRYPPANLVIAGEATLALGQPDLKSSAAGTTASTLSSPEGLSLESNGQLVVSDYNNHRVLVYPSAFQTGEAATVVLGQLDLTHGSANQGGAVAANTLNAPIGVASSPRRTGTGATTN